MSVQRNLRRNRIMNSKPFSSWKLRSSLVLAVCLTLFSATSLYAQVDAGAILGTVTDASGAIVKGAAVTLTATDSNGGVGTAVTTVFVQAATPLGVSITFTRTVVDASNTLATFTATVTGLGNAVVLKYQWDFGDGTTQETTTNQVTHNYTKPSPPRVVTVTVVPSSGPSASGTTSITP
jgi:PKD repeat protein